MEPTIEPESNTKRNVLVISVFILFSCLATFMSGFFVSQLLSNHSVSIPVVGPTGIPTKTLLPEDAKFLPGQHYFEDTVIGLTKDEPHMAFAASVTRKQASIGYTQNTRVSFFDGDEWVRVSESNGTQDSAIVSNGILKNWNIAIDPSRVLKQEILGSVVAKNTNISFETGELQNEIGMRSLPGYTKFMSEGKGKVTIEGISHDAYIVYTRIYSLNASDIQFYSEPLGLTTDWLVFWDTQGNFYHIDQTSVDKPTPIYQTHQIGVMKDTDGKVAKTFSVQATRDDVTLPENIRFGLGVPLSTDIIVRRLNMVNKAPNNDYSWFMGTVNGTVSMSSGEQIQGVGILEYIHN